jgi:predicted kinase
MPNEDAAGVALRRLAAAYGLVQTDQDRKLALIRGHGQGMRAVLIAEWMRAAVMQLAADHRADCAAVGCRTCVGVRNILAMLVAADVADTDGRFQSIITQLDEP